MDENLTPKNCVYALSHLNQRGESNKVTPCFRCATVLGNYSTEKLSEIINNSAAKEHRKTLQSGQWPLGCISCKDYEDQGVESTRQFGLRRYDVNELLKNYNPVTGEIKELKFIEIRFGNECNLACMHCNPEYSSRWEAIFKDPNNKELISKLHRPKGKQGFNFSDGYFEDILENIVPTLSEIMFSGGETLLQRKHYEFISAIPEEYAKNIKLFYVTNGTIRNFKKYDLVSVWKKFREVLVTVSTDGVGERFEYFRHGASWKTVEDNINYWKENGITVCAEYTISAYQMFYLPETIDYLHDTKLVNYINPNIVQYPAVINPRIIPKSIKEKINNEFNDYLNTISDNKKFEVAKRVGNFAINYMMGENKSISVNPKKPNYVEKVPTWKEFEEQALALDKLLKTDITKYFGKISDTFGKNYE